MELWLPIITLKSLLPLLAVIAGILVITTKNAIISVFNLIVLFILVAFYLIYIGMSYLGISYIIIYIGAIAILFLFVIMMIDIEVVEKRSNNYLPLLFLLLGGFLLMLKKVLYYIGLVKIKTLSFEEKIYEKPILFNRSELVEFVKNGNNKESNNFFSLNIEIPKNDYQLDRFKDNRTIFDESNNVYSTFDLDKYIYSEIIKRNEDFFYLVNKDKNNKFENNRNSFDSFTTHSHLNDSPHFLSPTYYINSKNNYLLITLDWESAINRITQISAIGDVLYTVYHSYIYILSVILLLGMVGAIILTGDSYQEVKVVSISKNKNNGIFLPYYLKKFCNYFIYIIKILLYKLYYNLYFFLYNLNSVFDKLKKDNYLNNFIFTFFNNRETLNNENVFKLNKFNNNLRYNFFFNKSLVIPSFSHILNLDDIYSESILGNLTYFILVNIIIAILLLAVNSYFSLSVKYLEKGGGFECGFTSFVQTRERFNVIFYRVSLLFLIFDLEIILAFPYTVIYQKNQNISKNNVIAFLYILIIGFIYELKEGALNIIKKAHSVEINVNN
jgi:NADH:ubiquinone oxidoreductase subunit 6 (subunit J)/NADH:ubiquinone oxidoreductase subunit 3 (subunit A)